MHGCQGCPFRVCQRPIWCTARERPGTLLVPHLHQWPSWHLDSTNSALCRWHSCIQRTRVLPWIWPDPTTMRPQSTCWVGEKMGYGLPPREVHLTASDSDPQQETPGTPVRTTWTHAGDFQQCQLSTWVLPSAGTDWHELEQTYQQRVHGKSQQDPRRPHGRDTWSRQVTDIFAQLLSMHVVSGTHTPSNIDRIEAILRRGAARFVMRRYRQHPAPPW